jgi:hypothetical protein
MRMRMVPYCITLSSERCGTCHPNDCTDDLTHVRAMFGVSDCYCWKSLGEDVAPFKMYRRWYVITSVVLYTVSSSAWLLISAFDFIEKVELVQTLDECKMSDYIPQSTSDGLREILLGCLCTSPREFAGCILFFTYFYSSLMFLPSRFT